MGDVVSMRDKLRAATVGAAKNFKSEVVEYAGHKFIVRQPSVAQRGEILKRSKISTGDVEKMDPGELQVWATVHCVYTEEGERVFEEADAESLRNEPSGGFVDAFSEVAIRLMNMGEQTAKNSAKTRKG
ncbi:MAG TPA: hypothetical protein GXX28_00525 [Firmicutes bacterium]|nr:hypothetical protein [Bacillota bacterium]